MCGLKSFSEIQVGVRCMIIFHDIFYVCSLISSLYVSSSIEFTLCPPPPPLPTRTCMHTGKPVTTSASASGLQLVILVACVCISVSQTHPFYEHILILTALCQGATKQPWLWKLWFWRDVPTLSFCRCRWYCSFKSARRYIFWWTSWYTYWKAWSARHCEAP